MAGNDGTQSTYILSSLLFFCSNAYTCFSKLVDSTFHRQSDSFVSIESMLSLSHCRVPTLLDGKNSTSFPFQF